MKAAEAALLAKQTDFDKKKTDSQGLLKTWEDAQKLVEELTECESQMKATEAELKKLEKPVKDQPSWFIKETERL